MLYFGFMRDFSLERDAFLDEFLVFIVSIGIETTDDFVLLLLVKADCCKQQSLALGLGDFVLKHFQTAQVVVGFGQHANAPLQIDRAHAFELAPDRDAFAGRLGRDLVSQ
ncbi:hypothetical protein BOS5A_220047 [Bosea sp. EC-HK365B]|nr:hypothetical protein BOSE7B_40141 [Bosea sp. 7B]CAD5290311.1 hypothetical protein BOSE21B_60017 [Bosea sp. 21B]VVT60702.1 hypothetical protein BOS5A_220047 [Bosea sp. EC-HK365B]VXB54206.1 hypothetical protein BOSE127_130046 [Bosea sp. 127]